MMNEEFWNQSGGLIGGAAGVIAFLFLLGFLRMLLKVSTPNKLIVVTGRKRKSGGKTMGYSVERGSSLVIPFLQAADYLSLDVFPINVRVDGVNSANGITLGADATACVCIDDSNEDMLYAAVERLMGKKHEQIKEQVQQTLVGNFRGALNKATPLQAIGMQDSEDIQVDGEQEYLPEEGQGDRALFRKALVDDINSDISSFGMKVVSVSLQTIWDSSNYIANLAQKTTARKRQMVEVEEARLHSEAEQAESDSRRRIEVAQSQANEMIVQQREKLELYRRESEASIQQARYEADNNIKEAENRTRQEVERLRNELLILQNEADILLRERVKQRAAGIMAQGEEESATIVEGARNSLLSQKVSIIEKTGPLGALVIFVQQQLPRLFEAFKKEAENFKVDRYLVMDEEQGFSGAVNRGPQAFVAFLKQFEIATGLNIQQFLNVKKPS